MKDFYDLYYFTHDKWDDIDKTILKQAISVTFKKRNSLELLTSFNSIVEKIRNSETLKERWVNYQRSHNYALRINYDDLITSLYIINNSTMI